MKTVLFIFALIFAAIFAQACKEQPPKTFTDEQLAQSYDGMGPSGNLSTHGE